METSDKLTSVVSAILKYAIILSIACIVIGTGLMFINGNANGIPISQLANYENPKSPSYNSSSFSPVLIPQSIAHFDAVFIGVGNHRPRMTGTTGSDAENIQCILMPQWWPHHLSFLSEVRE